MMQCLSGASTDQRMMLVSRPPEATYRELGAQATQLTCNERVTNFRFEYMDKIGRIFDQLLWCSDWLVNLCSVESPLPVVWLVISSTSREQGHLGD